jgi:site-specific DNA-methyltransferase (adenine-specific)
MEVIKSEVGVDGRYLPTQLDLFVESEKGLKPLVYPDDFVNKIILGDCLDIMPKIPDHIIDLVLCDLPYGTTQNSWDSIIPLEPLWNHYKRLIKPNGAILLTSQGMFSGLLMMSSTVKYQYSAVWCKRNHTNQLNAKIQLLRKHEDILIFYDHQPVYNPQGIVRCDKNTKQGKTSTKCYGKQNREDYFQEWTNWPTTLIHVKGVTTGTHSTEKPVDLFAWLIKTFSNSGDIVLDNAAGSCTTAMACKETGRNFICIEKDPDIHAESVKRFEKPLEEGDGIFS